MRLARVTIRRSNYSTYSTTKDMVTGASTFTWRMRRDSFGTRRGSEPGWRAPARRQWRSRACHQAQHSRRFHNV